MLLRAESLGFGSAFSGYHRGIAAFRVLGLEHGSSRLGSGRAQCLHGLGFRLSSDARVLSGILEFCA